MKLTVIKTPIAEKSNIPIHFFHTKHSTNAHTSFTDRRCEERAFTQVTTWRLVGCQVRSYSGYVAAVSLVYWLLCRSVMSGNIIVPRMPYNDFVYKHSDA